MPKLNPILLTLALITLFSLSGCRRNIPIITDPGKLLSFSTDTVLFDTVFTAVGSATQQLKVYNKHTGTLKIDRIGIAGSTAEFRLNIDGVPGNEAKDIEILPGDSIFIFVEVRVNPLSASTPLVINDSILFDLNGRQQYVELVAWGQDAHYIFPDTRIEGLPPFRIIARENETAYWNDSKPWVIFGYAVVDSAGALEISENTKIHFHKNSGLWVYRYGRMDVKGSREKPVVFQGARLDYAYRYISGQWDRIWINEGAISNIRHAIIKNGFIGIQAETLIGRDAGDQSLVRIENTRIENMSAFGIYAVYHRIWAHNLLVANCDEHLAALTMGGSYSFRHCTFANVSTSGSRQTPSVLINNYNRNQDIPLDSAYFGNCIIYGSVENEVSLDPKPNSTFEYWFDHSLIRIDPKTDTSDPQRFINIVKNPQVNTDNGLQPEALFEDPSLANYRLRPGSSAEDKGKAEITLFAPLDLEGKTRANPADLGCLER